VLGSSGFNGALEVMAYVSWLQRTVERMRTVSWHTVQHEEHAEAGLGTDHAPK